MMKPIVVLRVFLLFFFWATFVPLCVASFHKTRLFGIPLSAHCFATLRVPTILVALWWKNDKIINKTTQTLLLTAVFHFIAKQHKKSNRKLIFPL